MEGIVQEEIDVLGSAVKSKFTDFLEQFSSYPPEDSSTAQQHPSQKDYLEQLHEMKTRDRTTLYVDFAHVQEYDFYLMDAVATKYYRFEPFLRQALQNVVKNVMPDYEMDEDGVHKEFWVSFYNLPSVVHLRQLRTEKIGTLVAVTGTVTKTSEVRPELLFGCFKCMECGKEIENVVQQFRFTQPTMCKNAVCHNKEKWELLRDKCQFVDWQRVRIQENSDEVPAGSLPRSLDVILRHETVENARAGDKVVLTGQLMVVPDTGALASARERTEARSAARGRNGDNSSEGNTGLKALGVRELHYRMCFMASSVVNTASGSQGMINIRADEEAEDDAGQTLTDIEQQEIDTMKSDPELYDNLANSIAPAVFGHREIKRAVLLMLLGGVHKETHEGIQLRGDINVCIVGDPSCAKSQFLKYVSKFLPRAVYTSGKSSSAAGLTATVAKEQETGEFTIEAGALMLADNGICCIDEFDKMDSNDQVAIHEAMEQQTISIAKAGIQATLNARTSILAAANPAGGRYDKSKPLKYNVALPPAILSRFDLVHVMVDEIDECVDYSIAKHIINVHRRRGTGQDEEDRVPYTKIAMQRYIRCARAIKPELTPEAQNAIVKGYVRLRQGDAAPGSSTAYKITVRQLEAMVRLSEAIARLHMEDKIRVPHVKKAMKLLSQSIIHVDSQDVAMEPEEDMEDEEELNSTMQKSYPDMRFEEQASAPTAMDTDVENTNVAAVQETSGNQTPQAAAAGDETRETSKKDEPPAQVTLTYEKFQKVTDTLVLKLREADADGQAGMKQSELIQWYMDVQVDKEAFNSYASMVEEYKVVKAVLQHLVKRDGTLIVIEEPTSELGKAASVGERVLAVNPNYAVE